MSPVSKGGGALVKYCQISALGELNWRMKTDLTPIRIQKQSWKALGYLTVAVWTAFGLVLLAALLQWESAGSGFRSSEVSGLATLVDGAPPLDSFSQPTLACAILQQHIFRLRLTYLEAREDATKAPSPPLLCRGAAPPKNEQQSEACCGAKGKMAPILESVVRQLDELHSELQQLHIYLDRELMSIDYENELWDQHVDAFLQLLRLSPQSAELNLGRVLTAAERCGRSEEVKEALRQAIEFDQDRKEAENLKAMLDSCLTSNPSNGEPCRR